MPKRACLSGVKEFKAQKQNVFAYEKTVVYLVSLLPLWSGLIDPVEDWHFQLGLFFYPKKDLEEIKVDWTMEIATVRDSICALLWTVAIALNLKI